MAFAVEDTLLRRQALAYVIELYDELTTENGAPTLGTQNQAVDFILADPDLCHAVAEWAGTEDIDEASVMPPQRLPGDDLYRRVRVHLERIMGRSVFAAPNQIRP